MKLRMEIGLDWFGFSATKAIWNCKKGHFKHFSPIYSFLNAYFEEKLMAESEFIQLYSFVKSNSKTQVLIYNSNDFLNKSTWFICCLLATADWAMKIQYIFILIQEIFSVMKIQVIMECWCFMMVLKFFFVFYNRQWLRVMKFSNTTSKFVKVDQTFENMSSNFWKHLVFRNMKKRHFCRMPVVFQKSSKI